jgi:predicted nucleic acid-binding protein
MSALYLLDTSVVLALVRGQKRGQFIADTYALRAAKRRPAVSIVTHGEVRVLAARNNWGRPKLEALQLALDNLVTVDISVAEVIDAYVEIDLYSQRYSSGARAMGKNDLWIAACAKAAGATLLTADRDFDHLTPALLPVERVEGTASPPTTGET